MTANASPNAGLLTEDSLARSVETVAQMEETLRRVAEELARSHDLVRKLVDRVCAVEDPPGNR